MLTLYHNSQEIVLDTTEYYVRELASGLDEIIFDLSIWDPNYALITEEANIIDRGGQRYLVKQIDAGAVMAKIVCQLDLDDWKASLAVGYDSGSKTVAQQISAVCPAGWSVLDYSGSSISRTLHGDYTPLQVCEACRDVYSVYIRWDNQTKHCMIYSQTMGSPAGSFATRELNLKEINYKGKSNNFVTRLYAYGKDGLSFADINSGKAYVDNNTYSNRIICGYWQDDRYTVKQNLLDDAREKLAKLAVPERSYDCAIVDLQATNPSLYGNLSFELFTVATLIDDSRNTAINYQVVERHVWPYHPDRNDVIFNSSPVKIQNSVIQIEDEIINPNSTFSQIWANRVQEVTDWLTNTNSHVHIVPDNADGISEFIFVNGDQPIETATQVMRLNAAGLGFSKTGVNGPFTNAFVFDSSLGGHLVADFITAGTMSGNRIRTGLIESHATTTVGGVQVPVSSWDLDSGKFKTLDGEFKGTISAATITGGTIDGATITSTATVSGVTYTTTISGGAISTNNITATGGTFSNVTISGYAKSSDLNSYATTAGLAAGTTTINGGCITTGAIYLDPNNYWNISTKAFSIQNIIGDYENSIFMDSSHFQIYRADKNTGIASNYWFLESGNFRIGLPGSTSPSIQLVGDGSYFQIYSDANNYWNLKTGAFKTTNGTITGTLTSGTSSGSKIVIENGELKGYYNNSLYGKINMVSGGIRIGESGSVFDAYIDVLDNNIVNLGASTLKINGTACVSGSFVDKNNHTITVTNGLITDIW